MLGTPTKEEINAMNPNYTEFKFPQIKAHPWSKVFSKRMPPDAVDLVSKMLQYAPLKRITCMQVSGWVPLPQQPRWMRVPCRQPRRCVLEFLASLRRTRSACLVFCLVNA